MGDRLSDEELQSIAWYPRETPLSDIMSMANELRERRAADLSSEEKEALEAVVIHLSGRGGGPKSYGAVAISALSKILEDGT
jgi:hypothetical protein